MAPTIQRMLMQAGMLNREPRIVSEETIKERKFRKNVARLRRTELKQEALQTGKAPPVFKKGRPRKYTPEEAKQVQRRQMKECEKRAQIRVLEVVKQMVERLNRVERDTHISDTESA